MFSDSWQTSHGLMRTRRMCLWQTSHALMRTRRMCLCWLQHFFVNKKKGFENITASFNTAHIDWSCIRIIIGANEFNIKSS